MANFTMKIEELEKKIIAEFDHFKDITGHDAKDLDSLLFNVRYRIDEMKNHILWDIDEEDINKNMDIKDQEAGALIRLQALAIAITSHVIKIDNSTL